MTIDEQLNKHLSAFHKLMESRKYFLGKFTPTSATHEGGVYLITEKSGENYKPIYVGESSDITNRIYQHIMGNSQASILKKKLIRDKDHTPKEAKEYLQRFCYAQFVMFDEERDRKAFENFAISLLIPEHNM